MPPNALPAKRSQSSANSISSPAIVLYTLGLELMDAAIETAAANETISKDCAFQYRDGLIIFLLALIPLRRRTFSALQIGKHLVRSGKSWLLDIPADDLKSAEPMNSCFRINCASASIFTWRSFGRECRGHPRTMAYGFPTKAAPWTTAPIYDAVRGGARAQRSGFGVNLHRSRHAALTFGRS